MRELTTLPVRVVLYVVTALTLLFVNAPLLVTIGASFGAGSYLSFPPHAWSLRWYSTFAGSSDWLDSIGNSIAIALGTAVCATILGTMGALGLVRLRRRASTSLLAVILAPMIIPHVALAIGLYPMLARIHLVNSYPAVIAGHTVVAVPLAVIVVSAALQNVDPAVERAASSLGASPVRVFREVTLPLMFPGVLGGALLAFTISFDELELALFLSGPATRTFPLQIWEQVQYELSPLIAVASVLVVAAVVAVLALLALTRSRTSVRAAKVRNPAEGQVS